MPELAEVEYYRRIWDRTLSGRIVSVHLHRDAGVFRDTATTALARSLTHSTLLSSEASGKQLLFGFSGKNWLGIHLGLTGELRRESASFKPGKHDHLLLRLQDQSLVFADPRLFGRVRYEQCESAPLWWQALPPSILGPEFTVLKVADFLRRHKRQPIKAVLLMQEQFPGIGNWMADEILWQSAIHPRRLSGELTPVEIKRLCQNTQFIAREALRIIAPDWGDLPDTWLFNHRWKDGGLCPATGTPLLRESIGGRTSCWSPGKQPLNPGAENLNLFM